MMRILAFVVLIACGGGNGPADARLADATPDAFDDASDAVDSGDGDAASDSGSDAPFDAPPDSSTDSGPPCEPESVETASSVVDVVFLVDRSGSMSVDARWASVSSALNAFVTDPETDGMRAALSFFPPEGGDECAEATYDPPVVPFRVLPGAASDIIAAVNATTPSGTTTPISAALSATLGILADDDEDAGRALILITDGEPTACDTVIANLTATVSAALDDGIRTYAIAVPGASLAFVDAIATAGGTSALDADPLARLPEILSDIRAAIPSCSFQLSSEALGRSDVNLTLVGTEDRELHRVASADACEVGGWYDGGGGAMICPESCSDFDTVRVELGCPAR